MKNRLLTHRCEGSLKNKISIRFSKKYETFSLSDDFKAWRLFYPEYDFDYDTTNLSHVTEIQFCPFCGEKLVL